MKLRNYFLYTFLGLAILFSSCKKELDLKPTDQLDESKAFQTITDLQQATNAAYGDYGAYANDMYVNSLLSDEAKIGPDNAGQGLLTYRLQYAADGTTGGDVIAAWGSYYTMIDQINRALANADKVTAANSVEEARRPIIKGQLMALRALAHFELLEFYAKKYDPNDPLGVPVMLQSNLLGQPKRNTVAEVMTQIETDFTAAKGMLPVVTAATFTDTVMNQINITAYQARVALYKGEWQKASDYATTVINSNVKPLVSGAAFTGIWTDANSNETLFRIRYATSSAIGGLYTTTGGLIYISPSDKLRASYTATDIRLNTFIGVSGGKYYVNKFYTSSRGGRVVDIKASRIAEMYLIRAEAKAQLNDLAGGSADLNAVRAQRITGYTAQTFADQPSLIDAVLTERFKELCFEGFRFFDLKRTGKPVTRLSSDVDSPAWQTIPANSNLFTLPIPQSELLANKNMVQNPGY